jgi:hypothetical protein
MRTSQLATGDFGTPPFERLSEWIFIGAQV